MQIAPPQSATMVAHTCAVGQCLYDDIRRHLKSDADFSLKCQLRQLNAIGALLGQLCIVEPILCDIARTIPDALGQPQYRSLLFGAGQLVWKELQLLNRRKLRLHLDIHKEAHGLSRRPLPNTSPCALLASTERITSA